MSTTSRGWSRYEITSILDDYPYSDGRGPFNFVSALNAAELVRATGWFGRVAVEMDGPCWQIACWTIGNISDDHDCLVFGTAASLKSFLKSRGVDLG